MKPRRENLKVSSAATLKAYTVHSSRMKEMMRKDRICRERITILCGAFATLLKDGAFVDLLTTEKSRRIPKSLQQWIGQMKGNVS